MQRSFRFLLALFVASAVFAPSAASACPSEGALVATPATPTTTRPTDYVDGSLETEYTYQLEDLVSTTVDNMVDEGRYVWQPRLVDEGRNVWVSRWVDEGRWVWQSNWQDRGSYVWTSRWVDEGRMVSQGYWEGAWQASSYLAYADTSHTAYFSHTNKLSAWGATWYSTCGISHTHSAGVGGCGHDRYWTGVHWNNPSTHHTGYYYNATTYVWNPNARWVDTSYWQSAWVDRGYSTWVSRWVDEGSNVWVSNWVDRGSNVWVSNWVDRGSNVWVPNLVNRPVTTYNWVARSSTETDDTYPVDTATTRVAGPVTTTYYYDVLTEKCSSPT